jgi:hypothetical protein
MMPQLKKVASAAGSGVLAGVAGTGVMTAFQRYVEMPLSRRPESFTPAELAEKVLHLRPATRQGRRRLNYAAHFGIGGLWGAAYGLASLAGLRGQRAVNTVFGLVYGGGVLAGAATGQLHPGQWSATDWAVDLVDIYVQVQATGFVFDRLLHPVPGHSLWPPAAWGVLPDLPAAQGPAAEPGRRRRRFLSGTQRWFRPSASTERRICSI